MIRRINPLLKQPIGNASIHQYRYPMLLIHVVSRQNRSILFTQLDGYYRITFQINTLERFEIREGEHFAHHLKDEGIFIKRKFFRDSFLRKAETSKGFYVQINRFKIKYNTPTKNTPMDILFIPCIILMLMFVGLEGSFLRKK